MLCFITSSEGKFAEVQAMIPDIRPISTDLPEIQSMDAREVIRFKLEMAREKWDGEFIVEDTSLYMDALNGLPGPLIKWFLQAMGGRGLNDIADRMMNRLAVARTVIGYSNNGDPQFFIGEVHGYIVPPRGRGGFGWDKIFQPSGEKYTFAEMTPEEKSRISSRARAVEKLKRFLESAR